MLISYEYLELQKKLHQKDLKYGTNVQGNNLELIKQIINHFKCETILDYGCGKGILVDLLPGCSGYDPAIEKYSNIPNPADLVICTDVLEHIEPEYLDSVFEDLERLTNKVILLSAHCSKAVKTLADGRNAHLIIENPKWWFKKIKTYFDEYKSGVHLLHALFIGLKRKKNGTK